MDTRISIDTLMGMKPQAICNNEELLQEFQKVRDELLKKGFKVLTFEDIKDKSSRLWYENRRLMSYDAVNDRARVIFDDSGYKGDFRSGMLNINRLIVIKTIAEYLLKVA